MGFHVGFQWGFLSILWEIIGKLTGPRKPKKPLTTSMLNPLYETFMDSNLTEYIYIYIYIYVCIYVCIYIYICVYVYDMYVFVYMYNIVL